MAPPVALASQSASVRLPAVSSIPRASLSASAHAYTPARPSAAKAAFTPSIRDESRQPELEERFQTTTHEPAVLSQDDGWQHQQPQCGEAQSYAYAESSYAPSTAGSSLHKDQNSVTIKEDTKVKDAAGAIVKVLDRLSSTLVVALQNYEHSGGAHEALNRAVKALAVCRKYLTDTHPGMELSFMPVNRTNSWGQVDPDLFSFLAFKCTVQPGSSASPEDAVAGSARTSTSGAAAAAEAEASTVHVSSASDPAVLASTIVRTVLEQGQAVMKAGGGGALFVAMTAVVQARQCLKALHAMDILLVPKWITENTMATLGRESKFVQFHLLPSGLHGVMPSHEGAARQPSISFVPAPSPA